MGFSFGTCIECGYNHNDHTYHFIEINTEILELVPQNMFNYLVEQHEKRKKKFIQVLKG